MIVLTKDVVYLQKPYWCNASERQLKMDILRPREYYDYDPKAGKWPLLVWICGGGFMKTDRGVHIPELVWFAQQGYVVASIDYSVLPYTEHPEQLTEVKAAIRFLKRNAEKYNIDKTRVAVAGESAGAYLAALTAATNGMREYDRNLTLVGSMGGKPVVLEDVYMEETSDVNLAIPFYTPSDMMGEPSHLRVRTDNFPNILELVTPKTVPMYMIHGTVDNQVPTDQSIKLYDKLQECGVSASRLTLVEGANHGDVLCFSQEIKERIVEFMRENM